ncbi:hypothetical protein [Streptomyces sp. NBC_00094]|uniref:hypothetical protein n=1 Tax=Streptomyces sp. NBC_00094 TaxID=2903620 RepID=UPI00224CE813|nr:hypothetical protein [Streptomyces sp. NBC_00094]MCX5391531.1 hypothetical protein [Streptomyces sp. NBC_00094]
MRDAAKGIHKDTVGVTAVRERLGVARPISVGVREFVRAFYRARRVPSPFKRMAALYAVAASFVLIANVVRAAVPMLPGHVQRLVERFTTSIAEAPALYVPLQIAGAATATLFALGMVYLVWLFAVRLVSFALLREGRAFRPVVAAVRAVRACGAVYGTAGLQRTTELWWLAVSMKVVRRELRRAHRVRGSLPRRGGRVNVVRAHVRSVVKCLDAAEARVDVDGDSALPALVVLLDQVADRYADGRLGALLDAEMLKDYPPGRDWEALRLALLAVVIGLGAVGAGLLALSDPVTAVLIASVGVLGVSLLYRHNLKQGIDLLGLWPQ